MAKLYLRYDLISQRQTEAQAYLPDYHNDFRVNGACFSASSVYIPMNNDLQPMEWVQADVLMTAQTPECAVRFRRYEWVQDGEGGWKTEDYYFPELKPNVLNAPRRVNQYITDMWHQPSQGTVYYVLETKGQPRIYAAFIHGVTTPLCQCGGSND